MADLGGVALGVLSVIYGAKRLGDSLNETDDFRKWLRTELKKKPRGMRMRRHAVRNLEDKITHLRRLANSGRNDLIVRKIAGAVLSKKCGEQWCVREKDWKAEIKAIFAFAKKHVRYVKDIHGVDTFQHPLETMVSGIADCDDFATLLAALLVSVGYSVWFRVIRTRGAPDWDHIFIIVEVPRTRPPMRFALDASTSHPPGWHPSQHLIAAYRDFSV